jgi:hypothetical protein
MALESPPIALGSYQVFEGADIQRVWLSQNPVLPFLGGKEAKNCL